MYINLWQCSIKQVVCRHPIGGMKRTYSLNSESRSPAVDVDVHRQLQVVHTEPAIRLGRRQW